MEQMYIIKKIMYVIKRIINEMTQEKVVYVMRGIPGSGKSTLARKLAPPENIFSTDDFFMVQGEYKFDPTKLGQYHGQNLDRFQNAIMNGVAPIVVDNTNIQKWEYSKYADLPYAA